VKFETIAEKLKKLGGIHVCRCLSLGLFTDVIVWGMCLK